MSSVSEDLHLRINALGSERILQLLDLEQTNRLRIRNEAERTLLYRAHRLRISSGGTIESRMITNHPPTFIPIDNITLSNNQSAQFYDLQVNDPDPTDTHSFSKVSGPSWVSISGGRLRIAPNGVAQGRYNATLRVTDSGSPAETDTTDVSITIQQTNRSPVLAAISSKTVQREQTLRFSASATDADNDPISYSITSGAKTGMSIHSTSGQFTWRPTGTQTGSTITIQASDGRGGTHSRNVSITVTNPPAQASPPVLDAIGPKSRTGTGTVSFRVRARDPNNLDITFTATAGIFGTATKQQDGKWTALYTSPNYGTTGIKTVKITAMASGGTPANETDSETVTITLATNLPPVLQAIGNKTVRRGEQLRFTARATDPEGDTISYSITSGSKTGMSLGSVTGLFTWRPTSSQTTATVTIRAAATGGNDSETITITVLPAVVYASPPVLESIGNKSRVGAGRISFRVKAKDPDDLPITFQPAANFGTITQDDDDNYTAIYTSPNYAVGTRTVTITATATGGTPANETDSESVVITVTAAPPPAEASPPVLERILNISRTGTGLVSFRVRARDPDDLEIAFTASAGTFGAVTQDNNDNYVATYTSPSYGVGTRTITITATATGGDPANETDAQAFRITVTAAPAAASPPVITGTFPDKTGTGTDNITFTVSDPNDLPLTVTATNGTITERTNDYIISATFPAAGQSKTVTIRAQATGGNPANEYTEISYVLTTPEIDYSPNITISRPIDGSRIRGRFGQPRTITLTISATRYNGNDIPLGDLTVTQTGQPEFWAANFPSLTFFDNHTWTLYATARTETVITVSYTDTVSNRAYTTETSVTVTIT